MLQLVDKRDEAVLPLPRQKQIVHVQRKDD